MQSNTPEDLGYVRIDSILKEKIEREPWRYALAKQTEKEWAWVRERTRSEYEFYIFEKKRLLAAIGNPFFIGQHYSGMRERYQQELAYLEECLAKFDTCPAVTDNVLLVGMAAD